METKFAQSVATLIRMTVVDHERLMMPTPVHTRQSYPEAMFADEVLEIDVRNISESALGKLISGLANNNIAVQRLSFSGPKVTHLRVWANKPSACYGQHAAVLQLLVNFKFVDGWQLRSDDPRDFIFAMPRRLEDEKTWVMGVYYGLEDGGSHGIWNNGTFAVTFADRNSTDSVDAGIYIRNGETVHKLESGKSFSEVVRPEFALL